MAKPAKKPRKVVDTTPAYIEAYEVRKGIEETVRLEKGRGHNFEAPKGMDGALLRLDGLTELYRRGLIGPMEYEAGRRYGYLYKLAHDIGRYRCLLSIEQEWDRATELYRTAREMRHLTNARRMGLGNRVDAITLCDLVCGLDERVFRLWRGRVAHEKAALVVAALESLTEYFLRGRRKRIVQSHVVQYFPAERIAA